MNMAMRANIKLFIRICIRAVNTLICMHTVSTLMSVKGDLYQTLIGSWV